MGQEGSGQDGPHSLGKMVQTVRSLLKYAYEAELIRVPVKLGPDCKKPSSKVMRQHRAQQPKRFFSAEQIRALLAAADLPMKCMILLGINCGFGNGDGSGLDWKYLGLDRGAHDLPRPKTAIARRGILWPETVQALRDLRAWATKPIRAGRSKGLVRYRPAAVDISPQGYGQLLGHRHYGRLPFFTAM